MNKPIRRLGIIVALMFVAIMASTTFTQFFQASALNQHGRNVRALYREFGNKRGPIIADGVTLAESVPVDSPFRYLRTYSHEDSELAQIFAPVTGFFSIVNGTTMLERTENAYLNGTADELWFHRIRDLFTSTEPQGSSVETTIDYDTQVAAWEALGHQTGAVVALEVRTGRILAMVSKPSFDPNVLAVHSTGNAGAAYQELVAEDSDPLINRTINALYPPGSTFKLIPAIAALETGVVTPNQLIPAPRTYTLPGTNHALRNFGGAACSPNDEMTLHDAMVISCNTAFAALGVELGGQAMYAQAERFGFNSPFEVPMRSAVSSFPTPGPDRARNGLAGIGQGDVTATPLQMAVVAAAIANNGVVMQPYLVDTVRDDQLETVVANEPRQLRSAMLPATARLLTEMMVDTVDHGTGTAARIQGVSVAGKTGTAQTATGVAPHAWFVAFAPADDPQIAVAVVVERGGDLNSEATGGRVAAPIARRVIEAFLR
ncbi:MAG: penicillin-binding protein 2 [Cellulomonadaceae bacterium]|jgi:peptidoglycan glycosyltransferase|nr:penicillin-binding protein 2 [Cellulomonadaceae bacterium]